MSDKTVKLESYLDDCEVVIWASITAAWLDYHKQYLDDELLPEDEETAPPPSQADIEKLLEAAPRYGVAIKVPQ